MNGKLIVIEGIDSSGKTTQLSMLKDYLEAENIQLKTIDFPRYEDSFYGKMIARFMRGEFGTLEHVNPYIISVIFALDRAQAKNQIEEWIKEGNLVFSNRYATSNMAHQAGRVGKEKREEFVNWEEELEYKENKIPREDIVLLLDIPYQIAQKLMENDDRKERAYLEGEKKDMVEENVEYLKQSEETYKWLAGKFPHWVTIQCVDSQGNMRSREDINEEIKKVLKEKGIL